MWLKMGVENHKLRVLHVTEAYGGGVATALNQYSKHDCFQTSLLLRIRESSHADLKFPSQLRVASESSLIAFVVQWFRHRKLDFDVIHVHSTIAGILVRIFPHGTASIAYSPHAFAFIGHKSRVVRFLVRLVEQALASRTATGGAVSLNEASIFTELGLPAHKVIVIPHHLEIALTKPEWPTDLRIISIGRLSYQKNPEAVKIFKESLEKLGIFASWTWVGAGDEEYAAMLKEAGVRVTGWIDNDDVRNLLANSTVLFHPARYEGLPMAVLESLAEGIPVIASDIPAHRSVEAVATFQNIESAVQQVKILMDSESWHIVSSKGREEILTKFNAEAQKNALSELYSITVSNGEKT
jgi:glycosyltransferase involved in cell wall biosynthesis